MTSLFLGPLEPEDLPSIVSRPVAEMPNCFLWPYGYPLSVLVMKTPISDDRVFLWWVFFGF